MALRAGNGERNLSGKTWGFFQTKKQKRYGEVENVSVLHILEKKVLALSINDCKCIHQSTDVILKSEELGIELVGQINVKIMHRAKLENTKPVCLQQKCK